MVVLYITVMITCIVIRSVRWLYCILQLQKRAEQMKKSLEQQRTEIDQKRATFLEERRIWESQNRPEEYVFAIHCSCD